MLEVRRLTKTFGGLAAIQDMSAYFEQGQITAIIGPNGAGKSTFFNLVTGSHTPTSGQILFGGRDVTGMSPDRMATLGVARTFQATNLFDQATVFDNLIIGHRLRTRSSFWDVLLNSRRMRANERACRAKAEEVLDFVGLSDVSHRLAGAISQEQRKRVALALALATEPRILLLDEPAGGINEQETANLANLMRKAAKSGLTICLIEHKMGLIMKLADKVVVLDHGILIAQGPPAVIQKDRRVIGAYLGPDYVED
jgi:ABC-type branched-subunit amino acid transport system ATPase component